MIMDNIKVNDNLEIFVTDSEVFIKAEKEDKDGFVCNIFSCDMEQFNEKWKSLGTLQRYLSSSFYEGEELDGFQYVKGIFI